jgi:5-methylthioadenosine/S-adenosylhomocysteine deaminase
VTERQLPGAVTVLTGATVVTMDASRRVLADGAVAFSDVVLSVGPTADVLAAHPDADVVDCAGRAVLPGFVNTHTHLFQTCSRAWVTTGCCRTGS